MRLATRKPHGIRFEAKPLLANRHHGIDQELSLDAFRPSNYSSWQVVNGINTENYIGSSSFAAVFRVPHYLSARGLY